MSAEVRAICGLGFPPKPYTQNANECMNSIIKNVVREAGGKKGNMNPYDFAKLMEKTVTPQETELKLAQIGNGEFSLKPEYQHLKISEIEYYRKKPIQKEALFKRMLSSPLQMRDGDQQVDAHVRQGEGLSVTAEDSNITNVPFRILTQMFTDAKGIINSQSGIVDVRGQTGHGYFVLNKLKMGDPLTLKYNEKTKTISCSSKCHSWNGYKICCHTIALAEHLGKLKSVLDRYVKSKKGVQLTDIANTDMSSSRGKKASKATERRKGPANKPTADSVDYVRETEPKQSNEESNQTITSTAQMFHVTFLAGLIKKCYGCGQEFSGRQRVSPNDLILKSFENRIYTSPRSKMVKKSSNLQNTYYHLNTDCVRKRHPNFEMKHVLVHEEIKESLTKKHCNVLRQKNIEV